jgi:two-component system chemotaxis response regulator CheB
MNKNKIRVLVVEDSALMRKKISDMINSSVDCEVVAIARDGYEAIQIIETLKPDVITLDLELPKMDGLTCLGYIMSEWPTPVIVLSAFVQEESIMVIKALEYGAIDFVLKPGGAISININDVKHELLEKIRMAVNVSISKLKFVSLKKSIKLKRPQLILPQAIVAIGASTGGPSAVAQILSSLPGDLKAGVIVIQHMPQSFIKSFAQRLDLKSELQVKEAKEGDRIIAGHVFIAPSGFETKVERRDNNEVIIRINLEIKKSHHISPSVDTSFSSIAKVFGSKAIGVILTGMGKDGTEGCRRLKAHGGSTVAEDASSCIVFGMPYSAIAAGVIDQVVPLSQIPGAIVKQVGDVNGR